MSENCSHNCSSCGETCASRTMESFRVPLNPQSSVKKVIGVVSGKGGVGKSLVTSLMACKMRARNNRVGILDADITGPSIPKAFGIHGMVGVTGDQLMLPRTTSTGIEILSSNLILEHETDPVIWRGPVVGGVIKQFWSEALWKDIDYMFVDMPPGTGDVPLTVFQSLPLAGIIIVTSPQELVSMIVAKAVNMAKKMDIPILELVENASSKKAHVENFITKFAKYYTPIVVCAAVVLAFLPPIILGGGFAEWIQRACIFLVISCPCALVISVPLGFFGGIGAASKQGVLVKGSNYLEALSEMKTIVFDKTGTLTKGEFVVSEVIPNGWEKEGLLEVAALAEGYSDHPISAALKKAYEEAELGELSMDRVEQAEEIAGHGIKAKIDGRVVYAGNAKLMEEKGWNQNDLAENSGVSITQINRLINGVGYPSLRTLERVAKAFGKGLVIEFI